MKGHGNTAAIPAATVPRRMAKKHCAFFLRNIMRRSLHRKGIPVVFSSSSVPFLRASDAKGKDTAPNTKNSHRNPTENVRFCEEIQKIFRRLEAEPALPRLPSFAIQRPPSLAMAAFSLFLSGNMVASGAGGIPFGGNGEKDGFPCYFSRRGTVAAGMAAAQP